MRRQSKKMILQVITPIFFIELETYRWGLEWACILERDYMWSVNFAICHRYLIVWNRFLRR